MVSLNIETIKRICFSFIGDNFKIAWRAHLVSLKLSVTIPFFKLSAWLIALHFQNAVFQIFKNILLKFLDAYIKKKNEEKNQHCQTIMQMDGKVDPEF